MNTFHTTTIVILVIFAFFLSVLLEFAALFASIGWDSGFPKNVSRTMSVATLVWIATCCIAIVFLVQIFRAVTGGAEDSQESHARLRSAATAMVIAGLVHIAVYLAFVLVVGSHTGYKPKAKPLGWLLLVAPGLLWVLAGHLTLKEEIDLVSINDVTSYRQLQQQSV
ncbi:hypothetical protein ACA910_020122 [Epithemia clementina (nom. ined.)]